MFSDRFYYRSILKLFQVSESNTGLGEKCLMLNILGVPLETVV